MKNKSILSFVLTITVSIFPMASGAQEFQCATAMPPDYQVTPPGSDVPEKFARLSGIWNGKWDGILCHVLIVEEVSTDGSVVAVYTWGTAPGSNINTAGYVRLKGKFKVGSLKLDEFENGARASYRYADGKLNGVYANNSGFSKATLAKIQ